MPTGKETNHRWPVLREGLLGTRQCATHALPSQGLQSPEGYNKEMASFPMGNDKSPGKETHSTMEPTEGPSNPMLGIPSKI